MTTLAWLQTHLVFAFTSGDVGELIYQGMNFSWHYRSG